MEVEIEPGTVHADIVEHADAAALSRRGPCACRVEAALRPRAEQAGRRCGARASARSPPTAIGSCDGRLLVDFCGNDYLGLSPHPDLVEALTRAAERGRRGHGRRSPRVWATATNTRRWKSELADWTGRQRAVLFSSGFMANLGTLQALLGAGPAAGPRRRPCVQDRLNHASLIDGAQLAGAELRRYPHGDPDAAARQLDARPDDAALLATDGVFSMDGDVAPLSALAAVCRQTDALFYVDDAHGMGVLGPEGAVAWPRPVCRPAMSRY